MLGQRRLNSCHLAGRSIKHAVSLTSCQTALIKTLKSPICDHVNSKRSTILGHFERARFIFIELNGLFCGRIFIIITFVFSKQLYSVTFNMYTPIYGNINIFTLIIFAFVFSYLLIFEGFVLRTFIFDNENQLLR